jgi:hypothetical protein
MVEKDGLFKSKARHVGIFDFKETYRVLFEQLVLEGYEVNETSYKEIIGPNGTKEVSIFWDVTKKISDYFMFYINIWIHPLAMTSVEVDIEGVKQKINKGDLTIEFKCELWKDYQNQWESNNFVKSLRRYYDKHFIRERIESYESKLISEFEAIVEFIKNWLVLTGRR